MNNILFINKLCNCYSNEKLNDSWDSVKKDMQIIKTAKTPLSSLAQRIVLDGLLDEKTTREAYQQARQSNTPFVIYLVKNKLIHSLTLATIASQDYGIPLFDLSAFDKKQIPTHLVSDHLIRSHHALPLFKRDDHLHIAISDPSNQAALDEIKFHTHLTTMAVLVEEEKLTRLIDEYLSSQETTLLDEPLIINDSVQPADIISEIEDAPIVRFVNKILIDAINKGASDIHFESYENACRIRFRIDGILHEVTHPPFSMANRIISRLKVMAQLDISERRLPQDGRFKLTLSKNRALDFRMSSCPTVSGEKIVMRLLDPTCANLDIDSLGFSLKNKEQFLKAIHKPQGMILVTGPTGSGKTVTLYSALNILNTPSVNISTVEDPVEIYINGINQVSIHSKTGLTFATTLRSFLRQDPDIIMVGEMRDLETADIAIKAAQTGHLVLSTLHTNSAPETLSRLVNMGIPAYNIATSVTIILAQRLARRLCEQCKEPQKIPRHELMKEGFSKELFESIVIFGPNAKGCDDCTDGYKGRVGLYEVMPISDAMGEIIMSGGNAQAVAKLAAAEGMQTLRQAGLEKIIAGCSSLKEINRVTLD
jgi:type IV pilus assembly protein PilB